MKHEVGLWIDRQQAVIVTLNDGTQSVERVEADFEKRGRYTTDMQPEGASAPHIDLAEDKHERHTFEMINHYYETVASHLKDATAVFIMGPGPAKTDFQKVLEHHKFSGQILGVEAADKLTNAQIAAKVRNFFLAHQPTR